MSDLSGRRILVTREADRAGGTLKAIESMGGLAVPFPTIRTAPPVDPGPLESALAGLDAYDWVVLSSVNGVSCLLGRALPGSTRFAAVGAITAAALEKAGARDVLIPRVQDADGLCRAMLEQGAGRSRVLVLRAEKGRDVLLDGLRAAGAEVDLVTAYRTACSEPGADEVAALVDGQAVHAALFMSPSAFDCFVAILGHGIAKRYLTGTVLAAVGRVTAGAMEAAGFVPDVIPPEPSVAALLAAVAGRLASDSPI